MYLKERDKKVANMMEKGLTKLALNSKGQTNLYAELEEIKPEQFTLMQDKRIKTIIEVTKKLKEKPLILEAEAPFSILAALIDPMKLYLAMQTEPEKLSLLL